MLNLKSQAEIEFPIPGTSDKIFFFPFPKFMNCETLEQLILTVKYERLTSGVHIKCETFHNLFLERVERWGATL